MLITLLSSILLIFCLGSGEAPGQTDSRDISLASSVTAVKICRYTDNSYEETLSISTSLTNLSSKNIELSYPAQVTQISVATDTARLTRGEFEMNSTLDRIPDTHPQLYKTLAPGQVLLQADTMPILVVSDSGKAFPGSVPAGAHLLQLEYRIFKKNGQPILLTSSPIPLTVAYPKSAVDCGVE